MSDLDLLRAYCPLLRLDSREHFPPCSPETFVSCPRVTLKRANGEPLAQPPELSLEFLGDRVYANGDRVAGDDVLGHDGKDYAGSMRAMLDERPELADVTYGRVAGDWLQFWTFYFWNGGLSRHEGDWEFVQIRRVRGDAVLVAAAQHAGVEVRPWGQVERHVERQALRPVLYIARGTHATYFTRGRDGLDVCDGLGRLIDPRLEVIPEDGWPLWRGRYGDTRGNPDEPWQTTSPPGPGRTRQWKDPDGWAAQR